MRQAPPNILLIMSDEHDPAVTGCYGDRVVQTPNLDRLATQSVTFDACYTTSPLCVPARLSFTAVQYVSRCGAWSNDCRLPSPEYPTLPRQLSQAGYESFLCGKMHYSQNARYGFHDLLPGDQDNGFAAKGLGKRREPASTHRDCALWARRTRDFFIGDESQSSVMTSDRQRTARACDFLATRGRSDKPFLLTLGYLAPHFPLIAPQSYYAAVKDRVPMPSLPEDWFERLPTNYRQLLYGFGFDPGDAQTIKRGRELYWALTGWLDAEIGKVVHALDQSAVADNTIVIYTSDHGENKGDHGMWWKNNMFEHSARIPLIIRFPDRMRAGERRGGACSLIDLAQTITEMAGARALSTWDGDSMLPWIKDPQVGWKDQAVSEYYGHNIASGFAMLRQGPWKYVYHTRMSEAFGPERELYDLANDPGEWRNLAGLAEHRGRLQAMHAALADELGADPDEAEAACRAQFACGYQPSAVRA